MNIFQRIFHKFFPTQHQRNVRKWRQDGGDERFRFNYELSPNTLVLDLGGYDGQWASDIYSRYRTKIYVFEPVDEYAKNIKRRFVGNPDISVQQMALGNRTRKTTIHIAETSSSIYAGEGKAEEIGVVDVKEWLDSNGISEIDLLKLNIEGGEYEVLDRLIEMGVLLRIKDIQVQFHDIDESSRDHMKQIQQELTKTHRPTYQYEFVWENWTRK